MLKEFLSGIAWATGIVLVFFATYYVMTQKVMIITVPKLF